MSCHQDECRHEEKEEGFKEDIIKLIVSALLLTAALIINAVLKPAAFICILMFALPFLVAGAEVIKEAFESLIKGKILDENFLMCVAGIGAFCVGEYPEAGFIMIFFGIGELFEKIATLKNRRSVKSLLDIRPDTARLIKGDTTEEVHCEDILPGDVISILPGERIPLDGTVIKGNTSTDNSALTGESVPVSAECGTEVFSGCLNLSGAIEIKVTKSFGESTASKILSLVENSAEKKAKSERFIRKFAKFYTPAVCIAAVLLATVPSLIWGNTSRNIYRALMFLVVSCPCALVVSVPIAYFSGIASAAKKGILIKGAQYLEAITRVKTVIFDKTGTLTKGSFEVIAIHPERISEKELLKIAASAEAASTHPISLSLVGACNETEKASDVNEIPGEGVLAVINGNKTVVGNIKMMKRSGIAYHDCHSTGTIVHVAQNGEYLGHIVIGDTVKPTSKKAVDMLKKRGIKTVMLTGDRKSAAEKVSSETGIDEYCCELTPEDKVTALEKYLNLKNVTAFAGDGINDAPVLRRADVGIAMGALGSDSAIDAADIVLMEDDPAAIDKTVSVSKKTQRIVNENIIFSLTVKFLILILCALGIGVTDMWMASVGDVGVLIIAVINSLRAVR